MFIFIFICILFFYYTNDTNNTNDTDEIIINVCTPRPERDSDLIDTEQIQSELEETAESYSLNFEIGKEEDSDLLEEYYIRGIVDTGGNYMNYDESFYEAYIENHTIFPNYIDKEHKIALFFQTEEGWADAWYAEFYEEGRPLLNSIQKTDIYLMKTVNNTESAVKIEQPFQNKDHYTVIYVYLGFFQDVYYKYGDDGAFQPYLEKAFESLGYINDKGQKKGDLF